MARLSMAADRWHPLPPPLAWRERVLTLGARRVGNDDLLAIDGHPVVGRVWENVSLRRTRRRLAALAREVAQLNGETFGPAPYRVSRWGDRDSAVSFRCLVPESAGGGALDRLWSYSDGRLVAVGMRSDGMLERAVAESVLAHAARTLLERVPA